MIETIAISIGTKASSEANTNPSTTSAPRPPSRDSSSTPGPLPPPVWFCNASMPVTWMGAPAIVSPASAAIAFLAAFVLLPKDSLSGGA